jgi:uncharacterized protein (TIGR00369 family)
VSEVLDALRAAFADTPLHAHLGLDVRTYGTDDEPTLVVVAIPVGPNAVDAMRTEGSLHGGAIATLADVACATSASLSSSFVPGETALVTADMHVRYLTKARGATVRCEARVTKAGRNLVVVDGEVLDDEDRLVAVVDFAAMVVPLARR